jgi:uncharacterized C2H2 Zn-finger protein
MPLATCRRCQAAFIVGTDNGPESVTCPRCGGGLEAVPPDRERDLLKRIERDHGTLDDEGPRAKQRVTTATVGA